MFDQNPIVKWFLTLFFAGALFSARGQAHYEDKDFPFQVLFAENVETSNGKKVGSLDLIAINETLMVGNDGFLSMVHHLGFPVEIDKRTTIDVKSLAAQFAQPGYSRKKSNYISTWRPYLEYLFIEDAKEARRLKLQSSGACHDCNFDLELIYPPDFRGLGITFSGDLCIKWQSTGSEAYEVELSNIFQKKLATFTSSVNELRIDGGEMLAFFAAEKTLLMQIKDKKADQKSISTLIREFPSGPVEFPFSCNPNKPSYALLEALYLELSPRDYMAEAGKYFELATTLSDNPFFQTMLSNFKKRHP